MFSSGVCVFFFGLEPLTLCLWMGRSAKPLSQRLGEKKKATNRRRERKKKEEESE